MSRKMTKKERRDQVAELLVRNLLMAVGFEVSNTFILDQDSGLPWKISNKYVRYNPNKMITIHKDQILFEPFLSKTQIKILMNIAIAKASRFENLYVKSIYPEIVDNTKKLVVLTQDDRIETEKYSYEVLIYYDMIYRLGNIMTPELLDLLHEADTDTLNHIIPKKRSIQNLNKKGPFSDVYVQP